MFNWKQTLHTHSDYIEVKFSDGQLPHRISIGTSGNQWVAKYDGKEWVAILPCKTRIECKRQIEMAINRILFARGGTLL